MYSYLAGFIRSQWGRVDGDKYYIVTGEIAKIGCDGRKIQRNIKESVTRRNHISNSCFGGNDFTKFSRLLKEITKISLRWKGHIQRRREFLATRSEKCNSWKYSVKEEKAGNEGYEMY